MQLVLLVSHSLDVVLQFVNFLFSLFVNGSYLLVVLCLKAKTNIYHKQKSSAGLKKKLNKKLIVLKQQQQQQQPSKLKTKNCKFNGQNSD